MTEEELYIPRIYWGENPAGYPVYEDSRIRFYFEEDLIKDEEDSNLIKLIED